MDLEEVKGHFKDAKEVRCLEDNQVLRLDVKGSFDKFGDRVDFCFDNSKNFAVLSENGKLAEIISYKEEDLPEGIFEERVMLVSEDEENWWSRVVFMEKNNRFIAWNYVKTIEEAGGVCKTTDWKYAKELPKEIEVTKEEIAKWKGCDVEQLIIK